MDPHARFGQPPSLDDVAAAADAALAATPAALRRLTGAILFKVEDFPDDEIAESMELDSPFDLLGLYQGAPLTTKSVGDPAPLPDVITLYRRPILDYWCETGDALDDVIRHVVIHEIGHHFGLTDEDMARIEADG